MSDIDLEVCIATSLEIAKDIYQRLILYKEVSLEPESTQPIPDLDYMCELAEKLVERLERRK
jgi:hypothetical protein